jgi:hypothetical protein
MFDFKKVLRTSTILVLAVPVALQAPVVSTATILSAVASPQKTINAAIFRNFFIPQRSPLHSPAVIDAPGTRLRFKGELWIPGTLVVTRSGLSGVRKMYAEVVPDRNFFTQIPYYKGFKPAAIEIENSEAVLESIIGRNNAAIILGQPGKTVQVTGRFLIGNYEVGALCDQPITSAKLIRANKNPNSFKFTNRQIVGAFGC